MAPWEQSGRRTERRRIRGARSRARQTDSRSRVGVRAGAALLLRLRGHPGRRRRGYRDDDPELPRSEYGSRRAARYGRPRGRHVGQSGQTAPSRSTRSIGRAGLAGQLPPGGAGSAPSSRATSSLATRRSRGGCRRPRRPLKLGIDYWDLGALPAGTLADGTTTLLAVNGCAPGQSDTDDALGIVPAGVHDPSVGNLGIWVDEARHDDAARRRLDRRAVRVRVVSRSPCVSAAKGGVERVAGFYLNTTFMSGRWRAGRVTRATRQSRPRLRSPVPVTVRSRSRRGRLRQPGCPRRSCRSGHHVRRRERLLRQQRHGRRRADLVAPGIPLASGFRFRASRRCRSRARTQATSPTATGTSSSSSAIRRSLSYGADGGPMAADAGQFNLFSAAHPRLPDESAVRQLSGARSNSTHVDDGAPDRVRGAVARLCSGLR